MTVKGPPSNLSFLKGLSGVVAEVAITPHHLRGPSSTVLVAFPKYYNTLTGQEVDVGVSAPKLSKAPAGTQNTFELPVGSLWKVSSVLERGGATTATSTLCRCPPSPRANSVPTSNHHVDFKLGLFSIRSFHACQFCSTFVYVHVFFACHISTLVPVFNRIIISNNTTTTTTVTTPPKGRGPIRQPPLQACPRRYPLRQQPSLGVCGRWLLRRQARVLKGLPARLH